MRTSPLRRVPSNLVVVLTVVLTSAPSIVLAQGRTLEVDDLRLEVGVSTPVLSPDGSQAISLSDPAGNMLELWDREQWERLIPEIEAAGADTLYTFPFADEAEIRVKAD